MPLIACEDCGKEYSPRAAACPHCGAPLPRALRMAANGEARRRTGLVILRVLIVVAVLIWIVRSCAGPV